MIKYSVPPLNPGAEKKKGGGTNKIVPFGHASVNYIKSRETKGFLFILDAYLFRKNQKNPKNGHVIVQSDYLLKYIESYMSNVHFIYNCPV